MSALNLLLRPLQYSDFIQKLISERTELIRNQLQIQDQLLKAWHHDIGGPINNMQIALALLNKEQEDKDVMDLLTAGCQILTDIHSNIGEFLKGHIGRINLENIELSKWLPPVVELYRVQATAKSVHIGLDIDNANDLTIVSDRLKLTRIISNLLGNAIKFTPKGKSIYIRAYSQQQQFCIEVEDEGTGIPSDKITDIFRLYVRLDENAPGMGIGLSICKDLVKCLQGKITVASSVNEGSCFTVCLPLSFNAQRKE